MTRYGKDTDPGVREQVASALFNQGVVLGEMGRSEEADSGIYEAGRMNAMAKIQNPALGRK